VQEQKLKREREREKNAIHIAAIVIVLSDSGQLEPSEVNAASRRADLRREGAGGDQVGQVRPAASCSSFA